MEIDKAVKRNRKLMGEEEITIKQIEKKWKRKNRTKKFGAMIEWWAPLDES